MLVHLSSPGGPLRGTFHLPASKSASNRALILRALAGGGTIENLSEAHDTQLLARLLALPPTTHTYDCEDAGTTLRFLTAYLAVQNRRAVTVTGTARMCERPIGPLVDALRELGAEIEYLGIEGFPPLRLHGFAYSGRAALNVRADVSSQFVSALLLVAPALPNGLFLHLMGAVSSAPYLGLTAHTLRAWGARVELDAHSVRVWSGGLEPAAYAVEADWSAASYAYALAALAPVDSRFLLPKLSPVSPQGDRQVAAWADDFGVLTSATETDILLDTHANPPLSPPPTHHYDFTAVPDLAQTLAVLLAARGQRATFTGLHSLRVKETDRVAALQTELARFGAELREGADGVFELIPGNFQVNGQLVRTYHDHRMAMAFAPLALLGPVSIENPEVVRKSFPGFWDELRVLGFSIT